MKRIVFCLLAFACFFGPAWLLVQAADNQRVPQDIWSAPEPIGSMKAIEFERGPGGLVHVIGEGGCCPVPLYYSQRDTAGNWLPQETIDQMDSNRTWEADLAVTSDGVVHVIWADKAGGANHLVYYSQRGPGGGWTTPVPISEAANDAWGLNLLANSEDEVIASWVSFVVAGFHVRQRSADGTWQPAERVDPTTGGPAQPEMVLDAAQNVHFFWFNATQGASPDRGVFHRLLAANGTWNEAKRVSDEFTAPFSYIAGRFHVLVEGTSLYLTWGIEEGATQPLFFAEYIGGQWSSQEQINKTDGTWFPTFLGGNGGNLFFIGGEDDSGGRTLWTRPAGGDWQMGEPLSLGFLPFMAGTVDGFNRLHLVWDNTGSNLQYRSRTLNGVWSEIENLAGDGNSSSLLFLKRQGFQMELVWSNGSDSFYSQAMIPLPNLPYKQYLPAVTRE
jgi:hypothetical protein